MDKLCNVSKFWRFILLSRNGLTKFTPLLRVSILDVLRANRNDGTRDENGANQGVLGKIIIVWNVEYKPHLR